MKLLQKLSLFVVLVVISPLSNAQITEMQFHLTNQPCYWEGGDDQAEIPRRECELYRRDRSALSRRVAYVNGLPGKTDVDKMIEAERRYCVAHKYNGLKPGQSAWLFNYCSRSMGTGYRLFPFKFIRTTGGDVLVFKYFHDVVYVDRKSGIIKQVVSNQIH